jgi:hypothetical protein
MNRECQPLDTDVWRASCYITSHTHETSRLHVFTVVWTDWLLFALTLLLWIAAVCDTAGCSWQTWHWLTCLLENMSEIVYEVVKFVVVCGI